MFDSFSLDIWGPFDAFFYLAVTIVSVSASIYNLQRQELTGKKTPFSMLQSAVEANVYRGESEVLPLRRESTRFNCYII